MFVKCLFQVAGTDIAVLEQTSGKPRNRSVCVTVWLYNEQRRIDLTNEPYVYIEIERKFFVIDKTY